MSKKVKKESDRTGNSPCSERRQGSKKNRHISKNTVTKSRLHNK